MLSEFKDNGYVVLKNAISKDALEFINATWDRLKDKPFSEHFPYVIGEHIISFHNDSRDPQFFRIEHKGGEDEISMNLAHPFTESFAKAEEETK